MVVGEVVEVNERVWPAAFRALEAWRLRSIVRGDLRGEEGTAWLRNADPARCLEGESILPAGSFHTKVGEGE